MKRRNLVLGKNFSKASLWANTRFFQQRKEGSLTGMGRFEGWQYSKTYKNQNITFLQSSEFAIIEHIQNEWIWTDFSNESTKKW